MIESLWLGPALILNTCATATVFGLTYLVLRRDPQPFFRAWVLSEGWRTVSSLAGTLYFFFQSVTAFSAAALIGTVFGAVAIIDSAMRFREPTRNVDDAWTLAISFALLSLVLLVTFRQLPEIFFLPAFLLLGGSQLAAGWAFWPRGTRELALGARVAAIGNGIWGLQSLCYPVLIAARPDLLSTTTAVTALLTVTIGMGMIILLLERASARELALAQQFRSANAELTQALTALSHSRSEAQLSHAIAREQEALVRQIVHDLRNSTQAMGLINEVLEQELAGQPHMLSYVGAIDRQLTFISNFLKQKLTWLAEGGARSAPGTDAGSVLEALAACFEPIVASKSQALSIAPAEPGGPLRISPVELEQILGNLVRNAHQHSPVGARIRLWMSHSDGWATFYVADDGPGIPAPLHGRIGRSPARPDGSGVGLKNVSELVTQAGGLFGFVSEERVGTTFHVTLPLVAWGREPEASHV